MTLQCKQWQDTVHAVDAITCKTHLLCILQGDFMNHCIILHHCASAIEETPGAESMNREAAYLRCP